MASLLDKVTEKLFGEGKNKPLEKPSDQSPDELKLVAHIKNFVEEVRQSGARIALESIWMTNVAYLLGFDSVVYDASVRQFRSVDNTSAYLKRNRIHVNKILPTIQNRLARLCKNPPRYDVRPKSSNQDDKDAARLSQQVLEMVWDKERINKKRLSLFMMMQQYGYSFIKASWDDQKGRDITNPETGETIKEGDVRIEAVGPLGVFTDPLAKDMEECQKIVHAKIRKLDYFRKYYPERGHLVKQEDAWLLSLQYEARINSLTQGNGAGTNIQAQMEDAAIELAYYEAPSEKYPKGRMCVTANGVLLVDKELPCGVIPFVKFDDILIGDRFASESVITHLRPVQDQYNRVITRRAQWTNRLLAGKYIAPKGHGLIADSLNDQSGEVLEYDPNPVANNGGEPKAVDAPSIPQYAYVEEEKLQAIIDDISGINEISRGNLPSASMPAIGMQYLQEQDQTRIGVVTENNEFSWADVGKLILKFVEYNYKTPRLLKLAGRNMEYMVKQFVGADLAGNDDVIVIRGSTIPGSKVLKRQEILNAYQQGLLGDPMDPKLREKVLSMLEYGDIQEVWADIAVDMSQIKRHIDIIEDGGLPDVNEADNHPLFYNELNQYRKSEKFDQLSDEAKANLELVMQAHLQELVKLANPTMPMNTELTKEMVSQSQAIDQEQPAIPEQIPDEMGVIQ